MKKLVNKLVRDRIPTIIELSGKRPNWSHIDDNATFYGLLRQKLKEEVNEVLEAESDYKIIEELADVYEVLRAICECKGVDIDSFEKIASIKRQTNGSFSHRIYLESITEGSENENI